MLFYVRYAVLGETGFLQFDTNFQSLLSGKNLIDCSRFVGLRKERERERRKRDDLLIGTSYSFFWYFFS